MPPLLLLFLLPLLSPLLQPTGQLRLLLLSRPLLLLSLLSLLIVATITAAVSLSYYPLCCPSMIIHHCHYHLSLQPYFCCHCCLCYHLGCHLLPLPVAATIAVDVTVMVAATIAVTEAATILPYNYPPLTTIRKTTINLYM